MDKEQLDILDKIEKLIKENEELKKYKEKYKCLLNAIGREVVDDVDTIERIIDRAEFYKSKSLFKEDN